MSYDYGLKKISKSIGLTGVQAKHIARKLKEKNIDPEVFDWEGAISDASDYGDRYGATLQKLKDYYGVDLSKEQSYREYNEMQNDMIINELMGFFESRSPQSKHADLNINAKKMFKPNNRIGVELWKKRPNQYDIMGVDDKITGDEIKDMDFPEAFNKSSISLLGDADKDKVPNVFDCKPFDPNRDGLFGRTINVLSMGRYGQSKADYKSEKISTTHFERHPTSGKVVKVIRNGERVSPYLKSSDQLMREYNEEKFKSNLEKQKAQNALIKQKLELQKLKAKEQQLLLTQRLKASHMQKPSVAQETISIMLGIPLPKQRAMPFQRPGYVIEQTGSRSRLPTGFRWKKIPKGKPKKQTQKRVNVCPHCGTPLMLMPGFLGVPVLGCPRCGVMNI